MSRVYVDLCDLDVVANHFHGGMSKQILQADRHFESNEVWTACL